LDLIGSKERCKSKEALISIGFPPGTFQDLRGERPPSLPLLQLSRLRQGLPRGCQAQGPSRGSEHSGRPAWQLRPGA